MNGLINQRAVALFLSILCCITTMVSGPSWAASNVQAKTSPQLAEGAANQSDLDRVAQQVTEFTLQNGLKFIVLERHQAPVISFHTYADVGGADEPNGQTGVAHYLEHLAFKGTRRIGTSNYAEEGPLLAELDRLFAQIQAAKATGDTNAVTRLEQEFEQKTAAANRYVIQNEFGQVVSQSGGVGLNATTSADATRYFYSLPSNKLELWMSLESERFLEPVFREFYKEKEVILEERRLRTENSPIGQMTEALLGKAFSVHPYGRPVIGYTQDLRNLTRQNVQTFFDAYYGPGNLTIAIVGDVNPVEVKRLAQTYFGRFPAKPTPPKVSAVEPSQQGTKSVSLRLPTQPWYLEGYHRPAISHPDHVVYDIIASLLSDGRTSRLYRSLVETQRVALNARGLSSFPGNKHPSLMLFYALSAPERTLDEVAASLRREIERLKTELVSEQELDRVKTQARANLLRTLDSNSGMAELLTEYEVKTGDWRNLFQELDAIAAVTREDILRVAQSTFTDKNRTVGRLLPSNEEK